MTTVMFNSSMPRSGSTLIQNILGQNPNFYVSATSGVLELIYGARANFSTSPEFKAQDKDLMRDAFFNFCKTGIDGWYEKITDKPFVVDKSRGWGIHFNLLEKIYDKPKCFIIVRDLRDVFASLEKKFRENPDFSDPMVDWSSLRATTTEKRVDIWAQGQPVGIAIERLYQMINDGSIKKMHVIKYEDLLNWPVEELNKLYKYLEIDSYKHDFNNIPQITQEDDSIYGIYGDHKIKNKLQVLKHNYDDVFTSSINKWIKEHYAWYFKYFDYRN